MTSKLYVGNSQATPSIVVEKQVPVSMPYSIQREIDANGKLVQNSSIIDLTGVNSIGDYALAYIYANNSNFVGAIDLTKILEVSGDYGCCYMFEGCTNITSVDLSSLTTISGTHGCNYMFEGCTNITSVDLSSLAMIPADNACSRMFTKCTSLKQIYFPSLTSNSFGSFTNQFSSLLFGIKQCTVHFPINLQSVIGGWDDVVRGFSGTSTTVLFDLPATE